MADPEEPRQTPNERYLAGTAAAPSNIPGGLDYHEKMRLRAAADRARKVYPASIGDLIHYELMAWAEFGFRFGRYGMIRGVVDDVMKRPVPEADGA